MSIYSETIGSFIRTGSYPLEANYIFDTYQDLVDFYSDPLQKALLHEGWIKLVRDNGEGVQALYWVDRIDDELQFTELLAGSNVENIQKLVAKINKEVNDRQTADEAIWGTADRTEIPSDLNSIYKLAMYVSVIGSDHENLKTLIGTADDDIVNYLATLDYHTITEISEALAALAASFDSGGKSLSEVIEDLWNRIEGDPLPAEDLRTLRGIEDFIRVLKAENENRDHNLQTELDQTQVGVGLSGDGAYNADKETYYLKEATSVMNALKILDSLINDAINNTNLQVNDTSSLHLDIIKLPTSTTLKGDVKISDESGNGIIVKSDGLYYKVESEYSNGILTLKVNDAIIAQHDLAILAIVLDSYYDSGTELIVIVFKLHDGNTLTIRIDARTIIREWTIDNSQPNKVVQLEKVDAIGPGQDKLSADVRLSSNTDNILIKSGNTLYVKGTADNIRTNSGETVEARLLNADNALLTAILQERTDRIAGDDNLKNELNNSTSDLNQRLNAEITRATSLESGLRADLSQEVTRALTQEGTLSTAIATETNRALGKESDLENRLNQEINRATLEEGRLSTELSNKVSNVQLKTINSNVYELWVDGVRDGVINIPSAQILNGVSFVYSGPKWDNKYGTTLANRYTVEPSKTDAAGLLFDEDISDDVLRMEFVIGGSVSAGIQIVDIPIGSLVEAAVMPVRNYVQTKTYAEINNVSDIDSSVSDLKAINIDDPTRSAVDGTINNGATGNIKLNLVVSEYD